MKTFRSLRRLPGCLAIFVVVPHLLTAAPLLRFGTGATADDLHGVVNAFQSDLGGVNNGVGGGPFTTGFRIISWDDVPDSLAAPHPFGGDYFNSTSPRGVSLTTDGSGFQVSAGPGNPDGALLNFGNIDPSYSGTFQAFSPDRLFTPVGSTVTEVHFFVPSAPSTPGLVHGFGVIFSDVDQSESTSVQFLDAQGNELFSAFAPVRDGGLSFLGVTFDGGEQVAAVRIFSGNTPLGAGILEGGARDLVVMDNFFYGEPLAVPEPSLAILLGAGGLGLFAARRFWRKN